MKKNSFIISLIVAIFSSLSIMLCSKLFFSKNLRLEQFKNDIIVALNSYLQDNNMLEDFRDNNISISLKALVNEGYLNLSKTGNDINYDYTISMLSNENDDIECTKWENIKDLKNLDENFTQTLYICTDLKKQVIKLLDNQDKFHIPEISKTKPYYVKEEYNYIKYGDNGPYRIFYVDTDSSLVLVNSSKFGEVFKEKTQSISYYPHNTNDNVTCITSISSNKSTKTPVKSKTITNAKSTSNSYEGVAVDFNDIYDFLTCSTKKDGSGKEDTSSCFADKSNLYNSLVTFSYESMFANFYSTTKTTSCSCVNVNSMSNYACYNKKLSYNKIWYKIRLNPCMKIESGSGEISNPYVLNDSECN